LVLVGLVLVGLVLVGLDRIGFVVLIAYLFCFPDSSGFIK
jgi:hypothetical protein